MTETNNAAPGVVLVTGAGRGIGRGIALALAAVGVKVGVLARTPAHVAETTQAILAAGGAACGVVADVTDIDAVQRAVETVEAELGGVDGLVNNAGVLGPIAPFWETPIAAWRETLDIDLAGPAICARAVLPGMVARRRGRIVNVVTGMIPTPHYSAYGVAKAGLARFSESLAMELRPHGVAVFAMGPGTVRTDMSMHSLNSAEGRRWIPSFKTVFEGGFDLPMERPVQLALDLLSGRYDVLAGLVLAPQDDLEAITRHLQEADEADLYRLRVKGFPNPEADRMAALRKAAMRAMS